MANSGTLFLSCLVVKLISCYRIISPFPGSNTQVLYKYCIRCISAEISFVGSISSASGGPRGESAEVAMTRRCVLPSKLSCSCKCPLPAAPTLGSPGAGQSCPGRAVPGLGQNPEPAGCCSFTPTPCTCGRLLHLLYAHPSVSFPKYPDPISK